MMDYTASSVLLLLLLGTVAQGQEQRCGADQEITENTIYKIISPTEFINETEFYEKNLDCYWNLNAKPGHLIRLTANKFSVELSDNCMWDYVEIKEVTAITKATKFCGWDPVSYMSFSNVVRFSFVTDGSYEDAGFEFAVELVKVDNKADGLCNSSVVGGGDDNVCTENCPIFNKISSGEGCFYKIVAPEGKFVDIKVKVVKFGSVSCSKERIIVYAGPSTQSEKHEICSDFTAFDTFLGLMTDTVYIVYENHNQEEEERFVLEYSFIDEYPPPTPEPLPESPVGGDKDCSALITNVTGTYTFNSPRYVNNKNCIVVIQNIFRTDYIVQVHFEEFELENSTNCMFDSLKVIAGRREDSPSLDGPYCGEDLQGRTFVTNGNSLRLHLTTDHSFALYGVTADITFVPKDECRCEKKNRVCVKQGFEKFCLLGKSCANNPCKNAGTCVESQGTKKCYCQPGFTGNDCGQQDGSADFFTFEKAPSSGKHQKGTVVTKECKLTTNEPVEYSWTFKGGVLPMFTDKNKFGFLEGGALPGGVLMIQEFQDRHEGMYACLATTKNGNIAESIFVLSLQEACNIDEMEGPGDIDKKLGESVILGCSTDPPAASITWMKDGREIDTDKTSRIKKVLTGSLLITDIQLEDEGDYTCTAKDADGCASARSGSLTVLNVHKHNKYCGQSIYDIDSIEGKISRGVESKPKAHPWHVIMRAANVKRPKTFCGGSLISRNYVLTAAHCIDDFERLFKVDFVNHVQLFFGTNDCTGVSASISRHPKRVIKHEDFGKGWEFVNDIALIELDSPIEYPGDMSIVPICLEDNKFNHKKYFEGKRKVDTTYGRAAGCGSASNKNHRLKEVMLPYISKENCEESLADGNISPDVTNVTFCAGFTIARVGDVCQGDSGGALVMSDETRWIQTGIVSSGKKCDRGHPSYFTNVGMFYDWIDKITHFSDEEVTLL